MKNSQPNHNAELKHGLYEINRRDFIKQASAMGAAAGIPFVPFAETARASTPKRGGHLVVGLDGASLSDNLDGATYAATYMQVVGMQIHDTLAEIGENGTVEPSLAESWETKPGAREWTVKLRKGVSFHNGKEMTAADVVYSINHHRGENSKSAAKSFFKSVTEIKASGQHEITVSLDSGSADFPYLLGDYHVCIVPDGGDFKSGIGTGPYILKEFNPGVKTLTERNPNYWNPNRGYVNSVETQAINDPTARLNSLLGNAVHLVNGVSPQVVEMLGGNKQIQLFNYASAGHYSFPMRCDMSPFDNNDLRLAVKYATNREELVQKVLSGNGLVANDNPIAPFVQFAATDIPQRPFDPDKAKFHFNKSGFSGPLRLSVSDAAFPGAVNAGQLMQASFSKAGMQLEVDREPADSYWDNVWMKKPFCASYWDGRPIPDGLLTLAYQSDASWNKSYWKRPKFDKTLIEARAELDVDKRSQMYRELQLMIVDDGGELIPLFNNFIEAASTTVKGYVPIPFWKMSSFRAPAKVWLES